MEFQHTAAWRRLLFAFKLSTLISKVSTHSRVEAAATLKRHKKKPKSVSTHSRVEAAAGTSLCSLLRFYVSTHSRVEAAAGVVTVQPHLNIKFQHTAAWRRLPVIKPSSVSISAFQHTAAWRRLHG